VSYWEEGFLATLGMTGSVFCHKEEKDNAETQRIAEKREEGGGGEESRSGAAERRLESRVRESVGGGGRHGDAHVLELGTGAALLFGAGVPLHDFAKFLDARIFLAEFEKGHALLVARRG
jgi:hypothetical protein